MHVHRPEAAACPAPTPPATTSSSWGREESVEKVFQKNIEAARHEAEDERR